MDGRKRPHSADGSASQSMSEAGAAAGAPGAGHAVGMPPQQPPVNPAKRPRIVDVPCQLRTTQELPVPPMDPVLLLWAADRSEMLRPARCTPIDRKAARTIIPDDLLGTGWITLGDAVFLNGFTEPANLTAQQRRLLEKAEDELGLSGAKKRVKRESWMRKVDYDEFEDLPQRRAPGDLAEKLRKEASSLSGAVLTKLKPLSKTATKPPGPMLPTKRLDELSQAEYIKRVESTFAKKNAAAHRFAQEQKRRGLTVVSEVDVLPSIYAWPRNYVHMHFEKNPVADLAQTVSPEIFKHIVTLGRTMATQTRTQEQVMQYFTPDVELDEQTAEEVASLRTTEGMLRYKHLRDFSIFIRKRNEDLTLMQDYIIEAELGEEPKAGTKGVAPMVGVATYLQVSARMKLRKVAVDPSEVRPLISVQQVKKSELELREDRQRSLELVGENQMLQDARELEED
ncbi:hypothetical protein FVE85_1098 [Porphyridium purpureum]|uniref:Uncharacterized protein n=1 Tax=Porphyridium purpureum TaxID=35688 RepID=A0A5J4Z0I6_PORPP|nr:hypothetical protein FVE85_1098 [Porphyridium purpureum]|eukprot:POR8761..scf208_2